MAYGENYTSPIYTTVGIGIKAKLEYKVKKMKPGAPKILASGYKISK